MNKLGRTIIVAFLVIVSLFGVWLLNSHKQFSYDKNNLIRLHVIANSDSVLDQALKYRVRDEVIRTMSPHFSGVEDIKTARRLVSSHAGDISAAARRVIREAGYDYPVTICMGHYQFPVKTYRLDQQKNPGMPGEITLPAGEYEALRVIIGSGRGANWWCVLFPPLCFVNPLDVASAADQHGPDRGRAGAAQSGTALVPPQVDDKEVLPPDNNEEKVAGKESALPVAASSPVEPVGDGGGESSPESWFREQPGVEYRFKVVDWFKASRTWLEEFIN